MKSSNSAEIFEMAPWKFYLSQNYPNPFKDKTTIKYCVAYNTRVQITVLSPEGEVITKLVDEEKKPGTYEIEFSAEGGSASGGNAYSLSSGTYFYRMDAGEYSNLKKMNLEK